MVYDNSRIHDEQINVSPPPSIFEENFAYRSYILSRNTLPPLPLQGCVDSRTFSNAQNYTESLRGLRRSSSIRIPVIFLAVFLLSLLFSRCQFASIKSSCIFITFKRGHNQFLRISLQLQSCNQRLRMYVYG